MARATKRNRTPRPRGGVTRRELAAIPVDNASLADLQQALAQGKITSSALTRAYLVRIKAYDRGGPKLNAVREINPDALAIARDLDGVKPSKKQPLAGVPILIKDNIATGDRQHTTAGSVALATARARADAPVVTRLRAAGAVILGKTNLTEFANILTVDMPSGYSSLGGQVKNPYSPKLLDDRGIPVVLPGGSSGGSAVAVAAGFCAAALGTETSGSLLNPATQNGLVTVKPTVGLVSCDGVIPISHSQDTVGPLTRTVRDAAILLNVLSERTVDYTAGLDKDGLKGARIGLPSDPGDPGNDVYYGKLPKQPAAVMARAIKMLERAGATVVRANIPTVGWIGGPGTTMNVLITNPLSRRTNQVAPAPVVFLYEFKRDLNLYLRDWATGTHNRTLKAIIAYNKAHARKALRFGQDLALAAEATRGDLSELEYRSARAMDLKAAKQLGLDTYMRVHKLDAVLFPAALGAAIAAKSGYPSVQVPGGFISSFEGKKTPPYPFGVTFTGRAWSEAKLLRLAYAFEQASKARRPPKL